MKFYTLLKTGILILLIGIFYSIPATAQSSIIMQDLPKVLPPSPNAASLGKFGDIPIGKYTGIPSVQIPLYTMNLGKFSLPISFDYHSGGLKVEEMASCVGLGWALSAGGVITRSVHGLPDESGHGYWTHAGWSNSYIAADQPRTNSFCGGYYDIQPDMFYFNFAGQSGKFILDSTSQHNARLIPFSNLKITHDAYLQYFQITDANGIIYNFKSQETSTSDMTDQTVNYISAWFLTSIVTPAGVINFTYATEYVNQGQVSNTSFMNIGVQPCSSFLPPDATNTSNTEISTLALVQISSPTETINLIKTLNRTDLPGASMLNGMTVKDIAGNIKKKFTFLHSYFGKVNGTTSNDFRLKLDGVDELSTSDSTQKKSYTLQYISPEKVPSIKSYAKDLVGFYNGFDANTTDLPYIDPLIYGPYIANQAISYGNRTSDFTKAQIGILQSIRYPTGGSSTFVYEGNDYSSSDGVTGPTAPHIQKSAIANAKYTSTVQILTKTIGFTISISQNVSFVVSGSYSGPAPVENGPSVYLNKINLNGSRTLIQQLFMINSSQTLYPYLDAGNYEVIATVDGMVQNALGSVSYFDVDTVAAHIVRIYPTGGVRIRQVINTDSLTGNTNTKTFRYRSDTDTSLSSGALVSDFVILDKKTTPSTGCTFFVRASSSANYLGSTQGSHVGYSMVSEKDSGNINNGKTDSYFYTSKTFANVYGSQISITGTNLIAPFGYSKRYQTDYDVYRGFLLKEIVYNAGDNIIHSTINNYNYTEAFSSNSPNYYIAQASVGYTSYMCTNSGGCCECSTFTPCNMCGPYLLSNYSIANYNIICPWIHKINTITTQYDQNGQNPLTSTVYYYYGNTTNGQLTKTVTANSKGDSLKTINIYPNDKSQITGLDAISSATLDSMVSRNMISPVVQEEQYKNNVIVSRMRTDYAVWQAPKNIILPSKVWYQVSTNPIESRIQFNKYDSVGNVLEVQKNLDVKKNYLYDYKSTYPIAEVSNADSASIAYTSFEANGLGNWVNTDTARNRLYAATGSQCYNLITGKSFTKAVASGKAYIVSYWSRSGAITITANSTSITSTPGLSKNGWTYYEHLLPSTTTAIVATATNAYIDELRLYPSDAQMTTYTYNPLVGLSAACSANNSITYYEYDAFNRLMAIKDMDKNILKLLDYQYQTYSHSNPVWQTITGPYCEVVSGNNTGNQITIQKNINPKSSTYGNTQTLTVSNSTACPLPVYITITYVNYAGVTGYSAKYTNTVTGNIYTFAFGSSPTVQTLGSVPQGTYTLTFTKSGGTTTYIFGSGCTTKSGTTPVTFSNVAVNNTGCKNISIDTVP